MLFTDQETKHLRSLLLSPEDKNKIIGLGLIQNAPEIITKVRVALCICAYLNNDFREDIEGLAHELMTQYLSAAALKKLQNQIIILDYAQYKFKVPEGWNTYQNPLRKYLKLHEAATDEYIEHFRIDPVPYSKLYTLLAGRIQKEWENHKKALFYYEKAMDLNPENTQAQFGFAMIIHTHYLKKGKRLNEVDRVLAYYMNAYKGPKNINSYRNAAMLCKDIEDTERSVWYFEEGLKRCPEDTSLLNNYANLLMKNKGDYKKAKELAEKGLGISPLDCSLLDTMAHIELEGFQNYEKAEQLFRKALKFDVNQHYAHTGLGDMYLRLANYRLAEHYYLKGLHNGLQYTSREVFEVVEKLEKLVELYDFYLKDPKKSEYYQQKIHKLCC